MVLTDARTYWDRRYSRGGSSGPGSTDYRNWKWSVIDRYVPTQDDVIDVGCGDLSFWDGRRTGGEAYTGLDFSEFVIQRGREKWPHARFVCAPAEELQPGLKAKLVMCMDVLFHVMDDGVYMKILENTIQYSSEWILIYTWTDNPFVSWGARWGYAKHLQLGRLLRSFSDGLTDDGEYQRYRRFSEYVPMFERAGFKLVAIEHNPLPESFGGLHVFRRSPA